MLARVSRSPPARAHPNPLQRPDESSPTRVAIGGQVGVQSRPCFAVSDPCEKLAEPIDRDAPRTRCEEPRGRGADFEAAARRGRRQRDDLGALGHRLAGRAQELVAVAVDVKRDDRIRETRGVRGRENSTVLLNECASPCGWRERQRVGRFEPAVDQRAVECRRGGAVTARSSARRRRRRPRHSRRWRTRRGRRLYGRLVTVSKMPIAIGGTHSRL